MTNSKKEALWVGPDGTLRDNYKKHFEELCFHPSLFKKYSKRTLSNLQKRIDRALDYLDYLYKLYELLSPYHTLSHNVVTSITAFRTFLGKYMIDKTCSLKDLQTLLFAALFHDTGYIKISELQKNTRARFMHVDISFQITKRFLSLELAWTDKRIYDVIETQRLTEYRFAETALHEVKNSSCGVLIIGADILQVTDAHYIENLDMLTELLFTRNQERNKQNQNEFFLFAKQAVDHIWLYLDAFYKGSKNNPYRTGWDRFVKYMKKEIKD